MTNFFKSKISRFIIPVFATVLFLSCQKELSNQGGGNPNVLPDLETKITSSVSGFVTDENNAAVMGSLVTAGGGSATTDKYGYFEIKNALVVKNAAVVTATKAGYFKGIKTYIAAENKAAFFRIKLIPKTSAGIISGSTGGSVTLPGGLVIALPANGVVNAASNTAYTGSVNVAAHFIDPTAADINQIMPGDLRGIETSGAIKTLTSFGMAAVELTGAGGELLQIATGKKATLTMPIPAAIVATAASTIPLWSFDEAKGLWKEEGQATKTGNTYVGEVSHFSFWNCDMPNNYVHFDCTIKDANGNPLPFVTVKVSVVGSPYSAGYGWTDSSGYTGGAVPNDANLLLEVFTSFGCGTSVYSQNFSTTNADISLGVITINTSMGAATVTGTVTDCSNLPVTNGYIIMSADNMYARYAVSSTGTFSFSTLLCNSTANATFIAEDVTSLQQSAVITQTLAPGANAIGNIQACGISIQEFITYTIDGGAPIEFIYPVDSIMHSGNGTVAMCWITGSKMPPNSGEYVNFSFPTNGIVPGGTQLLEMFNSSLLGQTTVPVPFAVNITEYGAVGEFIAGNFTGQVQGGTPLTTYNIVCSFRVRRNF